MDLKKGNQVKVITGKDKGKTGEILEINKKLNKIKLNQLTWLKNTLSRLKRIKEVLFQRKVLFTNQTLKTSIKQKR